MVHASLEQPSKVKAKLSKNEEKQLTSSIKEAYETLLPTPAIDDKRNRLIRKLETLFNTEWPGNTIKVQLFGSCATLLSSDASDVDICISTSWTDPEEWQIHNLITSSKGMERAADMDGGKGPTVQIWDAKLRLVCHISINNSLGVQRTRMMREFVQMDGRVRAIVMLIKHWSKIRLLNDADVPGTLSSYTWTCLVINFLQLRNPPVLPALHQELDHNLPPRTTIPSSFEDDLDHLRGFVTKNKEPLGKLLFGFFGFYAYKFEYLQYALSVRLGQTIRKEDKCWHANTVLCVEDPREPDRNLGETLNEDSWKSIHHEIWRAFNYVSKGQLEMCLQPYQTAKTDQPLRTDESAITDGRARTDGSYRTGESDKTGEIAKMDEPSKMDERAKPSNLHRPDEQPKPGEQLKTEDVTSDQLLLDRLHTSRPVLVQNASQTHGQNGRAGHDMGRANYHGVNNNNNVPLHDNSNKDGQASWGVAFHSQQQAFGPMGPVPHMIYPGQPTQQRFVQEMASSAHVMNQAGPVLYPHQAAITAQQDQELQLHQQQHPSLGRSGPFHNAPPRAQRLTEHPTFTLPQPVGGQVSESEAAVVAQWYRSVPAWEWQVRRQ